LIDPGIVHVRFMVETTIKVQAAVEAPKPSLLRNQSVCDWC